MNECGHRQRYRCLCDRRRLGFELERLWSRLEAHPQWATLSPTRRQRLEALLDVPERPATDPVARLETDVQAMTRSLVELAKVWHGLHLRAQHTEHRS